jgi:hypothetical protein
MYADAMTMVNNVLQTIPQLTMLVTAFAYVMGMGFVVKGLMDLKTAAISAASSSGGGDGKATLGHCLLILMVGACLLYLPSAIHVVSSTFWKEVPFAYEGDNSQFSLIIKLFFSVIQLVGVIGFIRGLVILSHNQPASNGNASSFTRGVTHLIGSILCIYMSATITVIMNTLGVTW